MRVLRGRAETVAADRRVTEALRRTVGADGSPAVRVWQPPRHVAFGPRDAAHPDFSTARDRALAAGFEPVTREVGGRAVAYTGSTVAVAVAEPADSRDLAVRDRYDRTGSRLRTGLAALGAEIERGEPPATFCPGSHSLSVPAGKVAGLAQRVRDGVALVGAIVVVDGHEAIRSVLGPVYEALGLDFDPSSVGSLALDGIDRDPETVRRSIEDALVGDRPAAVDRVRET